MIKIVLPILLIFTIPNLSVSQIKITGTIINKSNIQVQGANVVLSKKYTTQILAFAITDSKGFFEINTTEIADTLLLKITCIGYQTISNLIANKSQQFNFILTEKVTELPTVIVKETPITQNGDTTNYFVKSFTGKQDRVIGDVIAKLPGVEIDETTGAIKFNGKAISHYYIDGLDLLESKYNIANRNIPADLVDQVQLLANHQDIKLLDSLVKGTEPALNIKLKKKARNKLIGKGKTGIGITPLLWDNEVTGLQFNKGFQIITSYKNNNAGSILANELSENINIQKVGDNKEKNIKEEVLNKLNAQQPNIATNRYLFNNAHLLHFNTLKLLTNKAQLKFNFSYLNDNNVNENSSTSNYILPNGQIVNFTENRNNFINTNKADANIIYNVNTSKVYLKNTTKVKLDFTNEQSRISNPQSVAQFLQNPFFEYSNNFLAHLPIKKKIVSLNSKINFNKMPQQLDVLPGQLPSIFNQSNAYDQIIQKAHLTNFNTDNNISYFTKIGKVNQQFKLGSELIYKNLQTRINKIYNKAEAELNDTFKNNIYWNNVRLYAENTTTYGKRKNQLEITLPFELNILQTENRIRKYKQNETNIFFNPSIDYSFSLIENVTANIDYTLQNTRGNVSQISSGYVLNNYRNVNSNDSLLPINRQQSLNLSFYYKNSLKALFSNLSLSLSSTKKNLIYSQSFDGLFIKSVGSYYTNYQKSLMLNGSTTKYFIDSKFDVSLNYSLNKFENELLQQNEIVKSKSQVLSLGFKTNFNKFYYASFETNTKFDFFKNNLEKSILPASKTGRFQQFLKLYFNTKNNLSIYINNEFYNFWDDKNNKGSYIFGDIGVKQKFKKIELELAWYNFTNNKTIVTIYNNENLKQINSFNIRQSNLMLKCYFNF